MYILYEPFAKPSQDHSGLFDLDNLSQRIHGYIDLRAQGILTGEKELKEESKYILTEVMLRGEVSRGDAKRVTGLSERSARRVLSALEDEELVTSESHRSPVRFSIPPKVVGYYFPGLYPVKSQLVCKNVRSSCGQLV
ncbi:hypothetical protein SAMN05443144_1287 [Fodinibius roseus]|uniref:Uncharacterized protein n=1 Tax=Fodinibius roseus TaxID=1194090 RepID=A0A1M5JQC2_9BACT|nr:hypothetical protein SAMN05443144_1287 [Fodinibius roseus]